MRFFGFAQPHHCLDEGFDDPDVAADHELCQAIIAGRYGAHPDGWGNHDPLPLRWLLRKRRDEPLERGYNPSPADLRREAVDWRRPAEPKPERPVGRPRKEWKWTPEAEPPPPIADQWWIRSGTEGEVELTCDDCGEQFRQTAHYGRGKRDAAAAMLRQIGHTEGWTRIVGRDRCPECSFIAPRARRHTRPHKLPRLPRTEPPLPS